MTTSRPVRGRPRDPSLDERALTAARSVYADKGWSGFTIEEVARRGCVGKGSLYLRWPDRAALLLAAVRSSVPAFDGIDSGNLHDDLVAFGVTWMRYVASDEGALTVRLSVDQRSYVELRDAFAAEPYPDHIRATRALIRRGIVRGEIPAGSSPGIIADLVAGGIGNHVRATPPELLDLEGASDYVERLVRIVLAGVQAGKAA